MEDNLYIEQAKKLTELEQKEVEIRYLKAKIILLEKCQEILRRWEEKKK
ncbi:unnamed protein product [Bacillus thuringiensis DB27]|uniref:Uncharacterized protein n=1 Tax=Bacillus thuringiensis DB27 TaxID=1431339 RepID=W8YDN4_BACTU|nr:unnamed protein product [Bacillus thuringiensis DB27]